MSSERRLSRVKPTVTSYILNQLVAGSARLLKQALELCYPEYLKLAGNPQKCSNSR